MRRVSSTSKTGRSASKASTKNMCATIIIKLSIACVLVSIIETASVDSYATINDNFIKDFPYRAERAHDSNRLLLRDCPSYPFLENAVDDIRSFIVDKLRLPHLEWQILQATYTDKGLLFEMSSKNHVADILDRFDVLLRHKDCVLKTTAKSFFES